MNFKDTEAYIQKTVAQSLEGFIFQPNDSITWYAMKNEVQKVLAGAGINDYVVICNSYNNPNRKSTKMYVDTAWQYKPNECFVNQNFVVDKSGKKSPDAIQQQDLTKAFDRAMKGV